VEPPQGSEALASAFFILVVMTSLLSAARQHCVLFLMPQKRFLSQTAASGPGGPKIRRETRLWNSSGPAREICLRIRSSPR
jgi:hypothetical protein